MHFHKSASRLFLPLVFLFTACAPQKRTAETTFVKAAEECEGAVIPQRYIIHFADGHNEVRHAISTDNFINEQVAAQLDQIEFAEHDFKVSSPKLEESARLPFESSNNVDNWGVANIQADLLWQAGIRGEGVAVAVVDSGMDLNHDKLRKQVFMNPGESGLDKDGRAEETNGIDDDGNGLIDDSAGFDFVADKSLVGDYQLHGTHVSGIIAAAHDDNVAQAQDHVQGVAPKSKILPLAFLNQDGQGAISDGIRAIKYAASRGVRVINASWGGSQCSRSLKEAIAALEKQNIAFVAAAGNDKMDLDRSKEYPASFGLPAQITVGAIGDLDLPAEYSNFGMIGVNIFAPGSTIISTLPKNRLGALSGTSMAAPFVSGALALLFSAVPQATVQQAKEAIYATVFRQTNYVNATQGRLLLKDTVANLRARVGQ